jgi:hypothetical protein
MALYNDDNFYDMNENSNVRWLAKYSFYIIGETVILVPDSAARCHIGP